MAQNLIKKYDFESSKSGPYIIGIRFNENS